MELSLKIELTDRRSSGESRALFYFFFNIYIFYFYFSTENLGGPERGPERGPEGGPEGGSTFCLHPIFRTNMARMPVYTRRSKNSSVGSLSLRVTGQTIKLDRFSLRRSRLPF